MKEPDPKEFFLPLEPAILLLYIFPDFLYPTDVKSKLSKEKTSDSCFLLPVVATQSMATATLDEMTESLIELHRLSPRTGGEELELLTRLQPYKRDSLSSGK